MSYFPEKLTRFLELFTPTLFLNCYTTFMLSLSTLSSSLFLLNIGSSWYIDFSPTFFSGLVVWCALLLIFESSINCKGCSTLYLLHFLVLYTRVSFIISGCRLCWGTFFHRIHVNALLYIVFKVSRHLLNYFICRVTSLSLMLFSKYPIVKPLNKMLVAKAGCSSCSLT